MATSLRIAAQLERRRWLWGIRMTLLVLVARIGQVNRSFYFQPFAKLLSLVPTSWNGRLPCIRTCAFMHSHICTASCFECFIHLVYALRGAPSRLKLPRLHSASACSLADLPDMTTTPSFCLRRTRNYTPWILQTVNQLHLVLGYPTSYSTAVSHTHISLESPPRLSPSKFCQQRSSTRVVGTSPSKLSALWHSYTIPSLHLSHWTGESTTNSNRVSGHITLTSYLYPTARYADIAVFAKAAGHPTTATWQKHCIAVMLKM